MKQISQISIPTPCTQNWDSMIPGNGGNFCGSCQKTVIDFTRLTNAEILQVLSSSEKVCGRFNSTQLMVLNHQIVPQQRSSFFNWQKLSLAAVFIAAVPFVNAKGMVKVPVEQSPLKLNDAALAKDTVTTYKTITGCIMGKDDKSPMVGATIKIKGTMLACAVHIDGTFTMKVPSNKKMTLMVMFIGYNTQEIKFDPNKRSNFNIKLESDNMMLGEVVVTRD